MYRSRGPSSAIGREGGVKLLVARSLQWDGLLNSQRVLPGLAGRNSRQVRLRNAEPRLNLNPSEFALLQ